MGGSKKKLGDLSPVTCHLSPVTCHLSPVKHNFSNLRPLHFITFPQGFRISKTLQTAHWTLNNACYLMGISHYTLDTAHCTLQMSLFSLNTRHSLQKGACNKALQWIKGVFIACANPCHAGVNMTYTLLHTRGKNNMLWNLPINLFSMSRFANLYD